MTTYAAAAMAALLMGMAAYAQWNIGRYTSAREAMLTRILLIAVALGSGYVAANAYPVAPIDASVYFLIGFGAVHFPAAFILLVARARNTKKS